MKTTHLYREYERLPLWKALDQGIKELESNGDIEEKTARPYIVGYLAKLLSEAGLVVVPPQPISANGSDTGASGRKPAGSRSPKGQ